MASFLKDLSRVGLSRIFVILGGVGSSIITARYIGPEGNGIIAVLLVYPSLFMSIGSMGIRQSTTFFLGKKIYDEEKIKTAITQIWFFTTIFSVIVCFVLMKYFSSAGNNLFLVLLALLPIPFSLFATYNSGIFLGKNDISTFNKINWIPVFIVLILNVVLVMWLDLGIEGSMVAMICGPMFMFIILLFKNKFIQSFSLQFNWKIIKDMLSLGVIYALSLLIIDLNYKVDIVLLDKLSNPFELGIYSKGSALMQHLWQIPMLLSTIVFARSATAKDGKAFSYKVASLLRVSFVLVGAASVVLFIFAPIIIDILFGEKFERSTTVLRLLLPGVVLMTIFKVLYVDLAGKGNLWGPIRSMGIGLAINIVLNLLLVPKYGANGAAVCSAISYSVASVLFLMHYSKAVDIPIKEIVMFTNEDKKFFFSLRDKAKNSMKKFKKG